MHMDGFLFLLYSVSLGALVTLGEDMIFFFLFWISKNKFN